MNTIKKTSEIHRTLGKLNRRFRTGAALGIACLSSLLFVPSKALAQAANLQSFLKIDGIQGESLSTAHPNEIELIGFGAGVERAAVSTAKPQFYEVSVSKNVDKASPLLSLNCAVGKSFPTVTLTVAKVGTSGPARDFYKVVLSSVVITKVETKGMSGPSGSLTEEVSLSFQKIQWSVMVIDPKTGQPTTTPLAGFDLAKSSQL